MDLLEVSNEMMYVKYLTKCLASSKHSTNGRKIDMVIRVVIKYKWVYEPIWEHINKVVKAIGPGAERNMVVQISKLGPRGSGLRIASSCCCGSPWCLRSAGASGPNRSQAFPREEKMSCLARKPSPCKAFRVNTESNRTQTAVVHSQEFWTLPREGLLA